jgi:multiple antibiotic resistance protein
VSAARARPPQAFTPVFEAFVHKLFWPYLLGGLIALMSISNPFSKIPLFVSLTEDMTEEERAQIARKASVYGFITLTFTLFFGVFILEAFGISYGALRIAGGLTIALLGYRMLFGYGYVGAPSSGARRNIAIFPLAFPAISGPGAIAVLVGISTEIAELKTAINQSIAYAATVTSIFITCIAIWLTYRWARAISMATGPDAMEAVTRLMGFLLVCIGVQFVASGVRSFIGGQ